jgi:hypothetical protein
MPSIHRNKAPIEVTLSNCLSKKKDVSYAKKKETSKSMVWTYASPRKKREKREI